MLPTVVRPSILWALGDIMHRRGFRVDAGIALPGQRVNFSRISAQESVLRRSYRAVAEEIGVAGIAVPPVIRATQVMVSTAIDASYQANSARNRNKCGAGLLRLNQYGKFGLGMPFADAPTAVVINARTGDTAAVSGIWKSMRSAVTQTVAGLYAYPDFKVSDLWVILSPAARHGFFVDEEGMSCALGDIDPRVLRSVTAPSGKPGVPYSIDLSLLFLQLWRLAGVPGEQVYFDERNTLDGVDAAGSLLPSKRRARERGELCSSGLSVVMTERLCG